MNIDFAELRSQLKPGWSMVNIALTIVLLWLAWPLAILMVAYIMKGHTIGLDLSRPETIATGFGNLTASIRNGLANFKSNSGQNGGVPIDNQLAEDRKTFEQWKQKETDNLKAERTLFEKQKSEFEAERRAVKTDHEKA